MASTTTHEGYAYQDILIACYIIQDVLRGYSHTYKIDSKEFQGDKFDDMTISTPHLIFKYQIKYSNEYTDHTLQKYDLSSNSYQLAINELFDSWVINPNKDNVELRLCLAWNSPTDELTNVLIKSSANKSLFHCKSELYNIDPDKIWKNGDAPLASWRKLKHNSKNIDRSNFVNFCSKLTIETNLPKCSLEFDKPGELERNLTKLVEQLGIGVFPNEHINIKEFALEIVHKVQYARSRKVTIETKTLLHQFKIKTDYGAVPQKFPVVLTENVSTDKFSHEILGVIRSKSKVILVGEPGSGKSWFVENFTGFLKKHDINVIRHFCYIDVKDTFQKYRITRNVLYGNLINDILESFPELSSSKQKLYASDLNELNGLISNISKETIIIVDGIDHINRLFEFKDYSDLNRNDINIIDSLQCIQLSPKVKLLVVSQPNVDLNKINTSEYQCIPRWNIEEVQSYLRMRVIENATYKINDYDLTTSEILYKKSQGNPLYLKYLTDEFERNNSIMVNGLEDLPPYSDNLEQYYKYLVNKPKLSANVPKILAGVSFSLKVDELEEITGDGENVKYTLEIFSSVLRLNTLQGGYSIYHESFRRFMIDQLKSLGVSLQISMYNPLINWFRSKEFYQHTKTYRFYLNTLIESKKYEDVLDFIQPDFITCSVAGGNSWNSIKNNYLFLLKAVKECKNFPKLILLNELNKNLTSTENEYEEKVVLYCEALGYLNGFDYVSRYLQFEGEPTLDKLQLGLSICNLCDQNKENAPWHLYSEYFGHGKRIEKNDFYLYIKLLLVTKHKKGLYQVFNSVMEKENSFFRSELLRGIHELNNQQIIDEFELADEYDKLKELVDIDNQSKNSDISQVDNLVERILQLEHPQEEEQSIFIQFLSIIETSDLDEVYTNELCHRFAGINWFYNWLIFSIKIRILKNTGSSTGLDVIDIFQYLILDTKPFKGKPRVCDLYYLKDFIVNEIKIGLSLLHSEDEWREVINILKKVTIDTTSYLQRSLSSPLSHDRFFKLLSDCSNSVNARYILEAFQELYNLSEGHHLHSYLAEYNFYLTKLYVINENQTKAIEAFYRGVQFWLGYTFRKDVALDDVLESIETYCSVNTTEGIQYARKLRELAYSVAQHTDGKGTQHYPISWFEKYCNIDSQLNCTLYILHELNRRRYDSKLESSLISLMEKLITNVNPIVLLFICKTYPVECSENFLSMCLTLVRQLPENNQSITVNFTSSIFNKYSNSKDIDYSESFLIDLEKAVTDIGLCLKIERSKKKKSENLYKNTSNIQERLGNRIHRKQLSQMTYEEVIAHIETNVLTDTLLLSLSYYLTDLSEKNKEAYTEIIDALFSEVHKYSLRIEPDTSILFDEPTDMSIYYWVSRFVHQKGGWYEELVNIEAFERACAIDIEKAFHYLWQLLPPMLILSFNRSLTSNLIKALHKVKHDVCDLITSWEFAFDAINHRLPSQNNYDWEPTLKNEFDMTVDELLVCILFTRLRSNATERCHEALSGLMYLLYNQPELMIKPIKWFFKQTEGYLFSLRLAVLQMLYEYSSSDHEYIENFREVLVSFYPTDYFLIDSIIEILLHKSKRLLLLQPPNFKFTSNKVNEIDFLSVNHRHRKLKHSGCDIADIYEKFSASFRRKYPYDEYLDLYVGRGYRVSNIYSSDYILEIINKDLYPELYHYTNTETVVDSIKLELNLIIAQTFSNLIRPDDLILPSAQCNQSNYQEVQLFNESNSWIRVGHYEQEMFEEKMLKMKSKESYGGIIFQNNSDVTIPFQSINNSDDIFYGSDDYNLTEHLVYVFMQPKDMLESFKILWLNPAVIEYLELETLFFLNGLKAVNDKDEVVLQYNCWKYPRLGYGDYGLPDEIPKLDGAELLLRADYFEKVCKLFPNNPKYHTVLT